MRPACQPPRPLAGCRRKQSSIDGDPSFSIHLSLCSTGFHRLPRSYEEIRLLHGRRPVVVASFQPTTRTPSLTCGGAPFADPCRPPRVRTLDVLPLPAPIPLRSRLDFGRRVPWHAHPIGPACTGLHLRSVLQRASGFFPTRPHGARPDCLATPHLRAVAFGLRLLPTCSAEDLHLQSRVHAWHTKGAARRLRRWPNRAILDGGCARCHSAPAGRDEETALRSNKETDQRKRMRKKHVRQKRCLTKRAPYKGGQRRLARLTAFMRAVRAFAHASGRAAWSDRVGKIAWRLASSHQPTRRFCSPYDKSDMIRSSEALYSLHRSRSRQAPPLPMSARGRDLDARKGVRLPAIAILPGSGYSRRVNLSTS
jgi:hypothetical protein